MNELLYALASDYLSLAAYIGLFFLIIGELLPVPRSVKQFLAVIVIVLCAASLRIDWPAWLGGAVLLITCYALAKVSLVKRSQVILLSILFIVSLLFTLHLWPGFVNWKLLDKEIIKRNSTAYSLYLNFDKPLTAISFLVAFSNAFKPMSRLRLKQLYLVIGLSVIALLSLSLIIGLVQFEVQIPAVFYLWAPINLFMVCLAEEITFRVVLIRLVKLIVPTKEQNLPVFAVIVSSLIFALLHFPFGFKFMLLAGVAGFFYGLIYELSKSIWLTVLVHFMVNLLHFVFFTYPYYAGV